VSSPYRDHASVARRLRLPRWIGRTFGLGLIVAGFVSCTEGGMEFGLMVDGPGIAWGAFGHTQAWVVPLGIALAAIGFAWTRARARVREVFGMLVVYVAALVALRGAMHARWASRCDRGEGRACFARAGVAHSERIGRLRQGCQLFDRISCLRLANESPLDRPLACERRDRACRDQRTEIDVVHCEDLKDVCATAASAPTSHP
jgi:hypothetical protein